MGATRSTESILSSSRWWSPCSNCPGAVRRRCEERDKVDGGGEGREQGMWCEVATSAGWRIDGDSGGGDLIELGFWGLK
jgi:hypothetical protein